MGSENSRKKAERAEEERQQAEDARKLAAFDPLVNAAKAYVEAMTVACDHQYLVAGERETLLAALKEARGE